MLLLFPAFVSAQEVTPVLSNDYQALINADTLRLKNFWPDTINSIRLSTLIAYRDYYGFRVRDIQVQHGMLAIKPAYQKTLYLGGQFNTRLEIKRTNQTPGLQTQYVQGRLQNGSLAWRGAETGEGFSYGPNVRTLEYDGSNYAYDTNGKLVPAGTGNGQPANVYNNSIFRTAAMVSHALRIQGLYMVGGKQILNGTIRMGQSRENTFIKENRNTSHNLSASLEAVLKKINIAGTYTFLQDEFSNPNRNGFLNRVYQDALLTPVCFDNAQNANGANNQQAYSHAADNPVYLLNNNGNRYLQTHRTGSLVLERKTGLVKYKLTQSIENGYQQNREGYKAGSAWFPNGIAIGRTKNDVNYFVEGNASYDVKFRDDDFSGKVAAHYNYTSNRSAIDYDAARRYRYQRSAHDASLMYTQNFEDRYNDIEAGLHVANKIYVSNTASVNNYFLPNINAFVKKDEFLGVTDVSARFNAAYYRFNNELPVGRSFSQTSLLQYTTQDAFQFFPLTEVNGFDGLEPIQHREFTGRLELSYQNRVTLYGELFSRNTANDVFPVLENGNLVLKNVASHCNKGMELGLTVIHNSRDLYSNNTLSFFRTNNKVTDVAPGYDYMPVAGFSNVHTAIVKGAPLGSIVGSAFQRDGDNNVLIGNDGFPLVSTTPQVIGNPLPDFIMKMSNSFGWRKWYFDVQWEWKKGGQVWNGTQAVLDYYGRSATTAALRNTTGYVFAGMLQNKQPNNIPVSFYAVNQPVEFNRWTRYGHSGVAAEYIQKGDVLRLNMVSIGFKQRIRKYIQELGFTLYASNLVLYSAYKGVDPNQLLYDQPNATGLDFFNLPSLKTFGCNLSIQF
ncbi:hypothetical protein A3860_26915 [Niastella vici]|uniref:TonB-dependent receptor-like beta-barrel domain-containing protein n=1 Tax=Niastella vici TaxID=1703345 RepID=A0A1V9FWM7_9BACT|nr:hypothetical protein A3860_26915 [Niastella vici]